MRNTHRYRAGSAIALVALVAGFASPRALAADAPAPDPGTVKFEAPARLVFEAPARLVFDVSTDDGAATTSKDSGGTLTTLSGDVNFEVDSDRLTTRATQILDGLATDWATTKPSTVTITGHTDSVADDAYNLDLSKRRAKSVGDYLSSKVPGLSITTDGKGEAEPIADNSTDEGKAANRRVEIRAQ